MIPLFQLLDDGDDTARQRLEALIRRSSSHAAVFDGASVDEVLDRFCQAYKLNEQEWACRPFDRSRASRATLKNLTARLIGEFIEAVTPDDRFVNMTDPARPFPPLLRALGAT